jgi:hypothetical protein
MENSGTRLEVVGDGHYNHDDGDDGDAVKNAVLVVFRAYTMEQ